MRTKLVCILVSDETDLYLEQAIVCMFSVRKHNPDIYIEAVVDEETSNTLSGRRQGILDYINKLTVVSISENLTKLQRSRFIKTSLRHYIKGDFLFVDTDTIICTSLNDIDNFRNDICAVREYNYEYTFTTNDPNMYSYAKKVGLQQELLGQPYFNSGVMYVKDTLVAERFYQKWHECWLKTKDKGLDTDQTALCWANKLSDRVIHNIPDVWNCQIKVQGINYALQAKIIHYYTVMGQTNYILSLDSLYLDIKRNGVIGLFAEYFINNPALFLVTSKDLINLRNLNFFIRMSSDYRIFYKFIKKFCLFYITVRQKWINLNIVKKYL